MNEHPFILVGDKTVNLATVTWIENFPRTRRVDIHFTDGKAVTFDDQAADDFKSLIGKYVLSLNK